MMDRKVADKLISMLDDEIASLQRAKVEILQSVNGKSGKTDEGPYARVSDSTRQVHEVLLEAGKSMSPKELHNLLVSKGIEIEHTRMRQILHQNKKRLFSSRKRGIWKARPVDQ